MINKGFFQIDVSDEQVGQANSLVDYSIEYHTVADVFEHDPNGKKRQREFRFTGTLGEIIFADTYGLERPAKSFGAIDGQDFGQDFVLTLNGERKSFDIKTMKRKSNNFRTNYVLNIPAYQMSKPLVITDYYFCISIHQNSLKKWIASFLGYVSKSEIEKGKTGILYKAGTSRIKDDKDSFVFQRDTYEVRFEEIISPVIYPEIKQKAGYQWKNLLPPKQ